MRSTTAPRSFKHGAAPLALALAACVAVSSPAAAQEWAKKMFGKTDHDFQTVARGSDTVYKFEITNIYKEDIHIAGVRSSCGCTSPSIQVDDSPNNTVKTWGKGYIVAKFNTRAFTGLHSATLTVTIDRPFPAQVQLRVHGNIRGDVVFEPGKIDFARVDQGAKPQRTVAVNYAGRSGWRINDVRSASDDLEVELTERPRYGGRAAYNLLVRLKPSAKPGFLKEQLVLVTNDGSNPRIPLDVEGRIVPEISIAPANLAFGETPTGVAADKRMIVRGKQPFAVTKISCVSPGFEFDFDEAKRSDRHIIGVRYTPPSGSGSIKAPIIVETDLGVTYSATCYAYATLVAPPEPPPSEEPAATETAAASSGEVATEATPGEKIVQGQ
ncbi:MAG: DUF1573 domain-containing protein [Planctomycetota bacterium]